MTALDQLTAYGLRTLPGLAIAIIFLLLLPRDTRGVRIIAYILVFILIRDAMTPLGFWSFGTNGFFWIRFIPAPWLLIIFGIFSLGIVIVAYALETELRSLVCWIKNGSIRGGLTGCAAVLLIVAPLAVVYQFVPIAERGGTVAVSLLAPLLVVTMFGNLFEEFLFRGFFQGYLLSKGMNEFRAALASGTGFAFGHVFLASTVTSVGAPLLLFALYEGVIVSLVRMRHGVLPSTLAHGLSIWVLSSGLI